MISLRRILMTTALCSNFSMVFAGYDDLNVTEDTNGCIAVIHQRDPFVHKPIYRVGYLASEGEELGMQTYGKTFGEYLTATAGQHFDPPILFQFVPVAVQSILMSMIEAQEVDFVYAPVSFVSCLSTAFDAQAMLTAVTQQVSRGKVHELDVLAGVMFVRADNHEIETIQDFKGKIVAAEDILWWARGQSQFFEIDRQGVSPTADLKQVVITGDTMAVIEGVLNRTFDVGFVASGDLEQYQDRNGTLFHLDNFKVINTKTHVLNDGTLFPFLSSTNLSPGRPVIALNHVHETVIKEANAALVAMEYHARAFEGHQKLLCETTSYLSDLAHNASVLGRFARFRPALSYGKVRTEQEDAGFLFFDEATRRWECVEGERLWEDLKCPHGYIMAPEEQFKKSCENEGLACNQNFTCFCQPCIEAFEVDVFQYDANEKMGSDELNHTSFTDVEGCDKMSLCGQVQQTKEITFRAIDNRKRTEAQVDVLMHIDGHSAPLDVVMVAPYTYEFKWSHYEISVVVMEVFFDGEQIPESPFRVQVVNRMCDEDFAIRGMVADEFGNCQCGDSMVEVGSTCVEAASFAIAGSVLCVFVLALFTYIYMRHKNAKSDEVWQVHPDELLLLDEVIGQGSFGVVLLAEYRGTKVAIKRVLQSKKKRNGSMQKGTRSSLNKHPNSKFLPMEMNNSTISQDDLNSNNVNDSPVDLEADTSPPSREGSGILTSKKRGDSDSFVSHHFSLKFLNKDIRKKSKLAKLLPGSSKAQSLEERSFQLAVNGAESYSRSEWLMQVVCPWFDEARQRREEFKTEMRVLARLRHPCITTVMGAVVTSRHDPVMVMEYMEYGSLYDLLRNETMPLTGEVILQITRDLAQGLRFLHSSKPPILHGDLKARNILIDSRFRAKLCDFGLSMKRLNEVSGTPYWMAPEYLTGGKYTTACDIYSVGIILYEIFSRKSPYVGENYKDVIRGICNRRVNKRPIVPAATPTKFVDLMKKCWSPDVNVRPLAMGLDLVLMEMSPEDAEPLIEGQSTEKKNQAGDRLLYEIFPKHVVEALKKGEKIDPETHENVTVIFSDIVSFTDISRQLSPEKVCDMLDRLYVAMDSCARKHHVFKVETIGDAWMGVTNLENNQNHTHVKQIAEFAVDIVNEAAKIVIDPDDLHRGFVSLRVGFHSGSVVSNVIGTLNKRYCLFGDTVNTASRMESNSAANRILCSERSYRLLKDQAPGIRTKRHGKIQVKGKGDMTVYWVGDDLLPSRKGLKEKTVEFDLPELPECYPCEKSIEQASRDEIVSEGMHDTSGFKLPTTTQKNADDSVTVPSEEEVVMTDFDVPGAHEVAVM